MLLRPHDGCTTHTPGVEVLPPQARSCSHEVERGCLRYARLLSPNVVVVTCFGAACVVSRTANTAMYLWCG